MKADVNKSNAVRQQHGIMGAAVLFGVAIIFYVMLAFPTTAQAYDVVIEDTHGNVISDGGTVDINLLQDGIVFKRRITAEELDLGHNDLTISLVDSSGNLAFSSTGKHVKKRDQYWSEGRKYYHYDTYVNLQTLQPGETYIASTSQKAGSTVLTRTSTSFTVGGKENGKGEGEPPEPKPEPSKPLPDNEDKKEIPEIIDSFEPENPLETDPPKGGLSDEGTGTDDMNRDADIGSNVDESPDTTASQDNSGSDSGFSDGETSDAERAGAAFVNQGSLYRVSGGTPGETKDEIAQTLDVVIDGLPVIWIFIWVLMLGALPAGLALRYMKHRNNLIERSRFVNIVA